MLRYAQKALTRFQHPYPRKPQYQPHPHVLPKYGQKQQIMEPEDTTLPLNKKATKFIQEVTGTFLFYACIINNTMLTALSAIAAVQAKPTTKTLLKTKPFLDYIKMNDKAIVTYQASNMILAIYSDASCLSKPKARRGQGGMSSCQQTLPFHPIMMQFITQHK